MNSLILGFLAVVIVSIIPALGFITLYISRDKLDKYMHYLVSFAVGALLGNAIIHLLPEVLEETSNQKLSVLMIIGGVILFYSIEQFLKWRHCHEKTTKEHPHPVAVMNQIGDTAHNFLDGMLIVSSFMVNTHLGIVTTLAIILHEIPQEIADFSILLYAKWPIKKIVLVNIISAIAALIGVILGYFSNLLISGFAHNAVALTAGGFIYIACTDLIPDLHSKGGERLIERFTQLLFICGGVGIFLIL